MSKTETRMILKDYFETMTYAMAYEWTEENAAFHEKVLYLMLDICGMTDEFEHIRDAVVNASAIGTVGDISLIGNAVRGTNDLDAAVYDIKSRIISENNISMQLPFDLGLLTLDAEENAERGVICACKLLAFMKWLEAETVGSKSVAVEIWRNLAMNGDEFAIKALVYTLDELGDFNGSNFWSEVHTLLDGMRDSFSPFINSGGSQSVYAVRCASIITLIKRQNMSRGQGQCPFLDRAMLHYALYSEEPFDKKVSAIASGRDFYLEHLMESGKRCVPIGFSFSEKLTPDVNIA